MRNTSSKPPDLFTPDGQRDLASRGSSSGTSANVPRARSTNITHSVSPGSATRNPPSPVARANPELPATTRGVAVPVGDSRDDESDSDTEMASAKSSLEEPQDEEGTSDRDVLERIPNLFRLLDLVDEHGSGGIVEKMVIDQASLHRLLNTVQPGSYDSVSKINFKSLDKLSIKATGLYGTRSEIVKYLIRARCLSDDAATFLSGGVASSTAPPSGLRSGLYLVLRPEAELQANRSKQAYIVYWPEESTWDDQAASSSVRRNRVTFMRYLTKLTEQIVALVSPEQANNFVWETGARNKDLPADQADHDDDESRLFSFEVSKSLEQEEDAIGHAGFSVQVESKHLPKNAGVEDVRFVPGEQKAGLLVSIDEPSRMEHRPFRNELINHMSLERTIKSSMPQVQLGDLGYDDLMHLAKNGLENKLLSDLVEKVVSAERRHQLDAASQARSINSRRQRDEAFETLVRELKDAMSTTAPHVIWVESVAKISHGYGAWSTGDQYRWSGTHVIARGPQTRHLIYPLELTEQDSQLCQSNEAHVPSPKLETRHKFEFTLSKNRNIEFLQLIRDKCLAVISEHGKSHIYIEDNLSLDQSINKKSGKVTLNHDSLGGPRCLFAFDQATRLLAIVHGEKELKLSVYIFDEMFSGLRSRGSPIPFKGWYDAGVRIENVCFVSGTEEVCLIESSGRARIFSLITQQFRPAALQISAPVLDAFSAPDGSCLFVTVAGRQHEKLLAFHWASFGSNQSGIHVADSVSSNAARVVTRLE
ncbi:hypothetical protein FRC06_004956, partial [Ceratobasidium sp. 370]